MGIQASFLSLTTLHVHVSLEQGCRVAYRYGCNVVEQCLHSQVLREPQVAQGARDAQEPQAAKVNSHMSPMPILGC